MIGFLIGLVFSLLVLIPLTLTIWLLVYAATSATSHVGRCRRCQYDLRDLGDSRHCPECGHPFVIDARGDVISR